MSVENGNKTKLLSDGKSAGGAAPARKRAQKQMKRRIMLAVIALAVVTGVIFWIHSRQAGKDEALKNLQTAQAFNTTLVETVSASGTVTAQTGAEVHIGSQVTGVIKRLYADVGSPVKAGQVIAELDLPDTVDQLNEAESSLKSLEARKDEAAETSVMQPQQTSSDISHAEAALRAAQVTLQQAQVSANMQVQASEAAVRQAQATYQNASTSLYRENQLFKQGYVAASDVDTAQTASAVGAAQLNSAQQNLAITRTKVSSDLQSAQEGVAQAQAGLHTAQTELYQNVIKDQDVTNLNAQVQQAADTVKYWQAQVAKTIIRSPISGTVLQMAAQQGETLAAGLSAPTVIVVADLSRLQVDAYVDETDIGKVKLGQSATVTVDAYPDKKFEGKVFKIASGSTLQQNVVTYDVSIRINNTQGLLKPDMTTNVVISVGQHPGVIAVPNEGVKQGKSGSYVWLMAAGDKEPQMQPVQTGATDGTYTEITSGVNDGDTIVLAGWPPPGGMGNMQMTPFGMRPSGGGGGGGRGGGGGGR